MNKFAKLFDVGDLQVLYELLTDIDDSGKPGVRMTTSISGLRVSMTTGFSDADKDAALEKAIKTFNVIDQGCADRYIDTVTEMLNDGVTS